MVMALGTYKNGDLGINECREYNVPKRTLKTRLLEIVEKTTYQVTLTKPTKWLGKVVLCSQNKNPSNLFKRM